MSGAKPDFSSFKPRKSYAVYPKTEGERIPPKGFGSAVADPNGPLVKPAPDAFPLQYPGFKAQAGKVSVTSTPGIIIGEPAPSLLMDATIDGHQYKGVLYLVSGEQEQKA